TTEVAQVVPPVHHLVDHGNRFGGLVLRNSVHYSGENVSASHAQRQFDILLLNFCAGEADDLVKGRLSVAHRAFAGSGDFTQSLFVDFYVLSTRDLLQAFKDLYRGDRAKLKLLAP